MTNQIRINQNSGLKPECLSYREILAQSVAVIAPTTTPAANLALIYASAGNGTWLSFLLGLIGLLFVSLNINQFASRSASSGSLYTYIAKGLGSTLGVMSGWSLVLAYLFTGMSVLCGFTNFAQVLLSHVGIQTHAITLLALGTGVAWYVAYKDIQLSAKMMLVLEGVSMLLILLLGVIIWIHKGLAIDFHQLSLQGTTPSGVTMGIVLVVFSFSGFESSATLGDEAKKPLQNIPKSILQSTLLSGLFFIVMAYIEVLGFSGSSTNLGKSEAPLDFLAHQAGVSFLGDLIGLGAMLSFFACVLASLNPAARVFYTMARHGLFHASLGEAHKSNQTPHIAVAIAAIFTFVIPASMTVLGLKPFDSMAYLGTICTYGFLLTYILVSIAAPVYLYRLRILRPLDVVFSLLAVSFMMLPILGTVGIPGSSLFPVPEAPYNSFPYLFLLYLGVSCGWFAIQRWRSPKLIMQMKRSIEAIHVRFRDSENL